MHLNKNKNLSKNVFFIVLIFLKEIKLENCVMQCSSMCCDVLSNPKQYKYLKLHGLKKNYCFL